MKKADLIRKYQDDIAIAMILKYRDCIEGDGKQQYDIFIWEDGKIVTVKGPRDDSDKEQLQGDTPNGKHYVCTIKTAPDFNIWDHADISDPDDEQSRKEAREDAIIELVKEYDPFETLREVVKDEEE